MCNQLNIESNKLLGMNDEMMRCYRLGFDEAASGVAGDEAASEEHERHERYEHHEQ
jgi:hypothetical protein